MGTRPSFGSGKFRTLLGILASYFTNFFKSPGTPYVGYGEEPWRRKGARKSKGGHPSSRDRTTTYRAWKKAFGGLAVPAYVNDGTLLQKASGHRG